LTQGLQKRAISEWKLNGSRRLEMLSTPVGMISMGAYLPAKGISTEQKGKLVTYLSNGTLLPTEYIEQIDELGHLPGSIETNYEGWEKQPWFETWLKNLPPKKRDEPFQGTKERRRVPFDPVSLRESIVPHPMLPSDAETLAGALALFNGNIDKDEIDLVMVASQVPDLLLPANASLVQHKLRLKHAGAYHVDTCCSSFVTMLEIAAALVKAGIKEKILTVASYIDSIINDKSTYFSVVTGDAAVAAVISNVEEGYGYLASHSTSHGSRHDGIIVQRRPPEMFRSTDHGHNSEQSFTTFYNQEANQEIAANAQKDMLNVVNEALKKAGSSISDVDFFVTHQPVHWAADAWREELGIPKEKFYETFQKYGNIANCSAPVNLLEAIESKLVKGGHLVLIASSGAGENHIAVLERINQQLIRCLNH
jgi:3-oxoacyl-[acyl-carrier-protein] synthase-3